ncbi:MAG: hypothetical protein HY275_19250 [Gemmatimonadetes bacterium]|nr:hypothetical protein [Gemmatimonadota bacterium]
MTSSRSHDTVPHAQGIRWVLLDGAMRAAEEFRGIPARERPDVRCPECRERVTLKLGRVRVPHAAHRSGSTCVLRTNEGALHFNTKHAIAAALRDATPRELLIEVPCVGAIPAMEPVAPWTYPAHASHARCLVWRRHVWAADWDEVRVEHHEDSIRPDIALMRAGQILTAIEVRVQHAVDAEKEAEFARHGTPWIEVDACLPPFSDSFSWTSALPIRLVAFGPWLDNKPPVELLCPSHEDKAGYQEDGIERELPFAATVADRYVDGEESPARQIIVLDLVINHGQGWAVQARRADERDHAEIVRVPFAPALVPRRVADVWSAFKVEGPMREAALAAWRALEARLKGRGAVLDVMPWAPSTSVLTAKRDAVDLYLWPPAFERSDSGAWVRSPEFESGVWNLDFASPDQRADARTRRQQSNAALRKFTDAATMARQLFPWPQTGTVVTNVGRAPTWDPAGPINAKPYGVILAVSEGERLRDRTDLAGQPYVWVTARDGVSMEHVAREMTHAGVTPVMLSIVPPRRAEIRWRAPHLPILMCVREPTAPETFRVGNVDDGPSDPASVARGLQSGTLRWDEDARRWRWQADPAPAP